MAAPTWNSRCRGTVVYDKLASELIPLAICVRWAIACSSRAVEVAAGAMRRSRTATTARPVARPGFPGEARVLRLRLKLLADVGLVWYPNAGKSTRISRISPGKAEDRRLPFTTLSPTLCRGPAERRSQFCRGRRTR